MTLREFIISWGFHVEHGPIARLDDALARVKEHAFGAGKTLSWLGENATRAGRTMTTFVTLPILGLGAALVKTASDAVETGTKFDAVFGDLAPSTRAFAAQQAAALGRSQVSIENYLALLQSIIKPMGLTAGEADKMSRSLSVLAVDLASFFNISEDDAVQRLSSAVVGNHEAMRLLGVAITQTSLDLKLQQLGFKKAAAGATEAEKAQARYAIIMERTTDAQGDAIRTAMNFANQWRRMVSQVKGAAVAFGKILLPPMILVVKVLGSVATWFEALPGPIKTVALVVAALAAAVGPLLLLFGLFAHATVSLLALATAIKVVGAAAMWAQARVLLLALAPLAAAGAFLVAAALIHLIADDIVATFEGRDSVSSRVAEAMHGMGGEVVSSFLRVGGAALLAGGVIIAAIGGAPVLAAVLFLGGIAWLIASALEHWDEFTREWEKTVFGWLDSWGEVMDSLRATWDNVWEGMIGWFEENVVAPVMGFFDRVGKGFRDIGEFFGFGEEERVARAPGGISPEAAPTGASAGLGAGARSVVLNSGGVTVNVPPGTPGAQARDVADVSRRAVREEWYQIGREALMDMP